MVYRVIQWATGVVAKQAVAGIRSHPDLELVGARVYSAEKDGQDVGLITGLEELGVIATRDAAALLAMDADCVCYMPGRTWVEDPSEGFAEICAILRSGKNVISLWWPSLVYPQGLGDDVFGPLQAACIEGGTSFFASGMDPGYGTAGLGLAALNLAGEVRSIHMYQFMNNSAWEGPGITLFYGFGQPDEKASPMLAPGVTTRYHATTLHLMAEALGLQIDEVVEDHRVIRAEEPFDIRSGHIPAGTISGLRYQVRGMVGGEPRIVVEHVEKLRDEDFPELDFAGDGYRAEVEGRPGIRLDMTLTPRPSLTDDGVAVATAMNLVNAIPEVCRAAPGVLSLLDLRPFASRHIGGPPSPPFG